MKKVMMAAALVALASGCISVHKNDGGDDYLTPGIVKDAVYEKYEVGSAPVTATDSLNVLFGWISWGRTASHFADEAPFQFFDKVGMVKNGAYANACEQAKCDSLVATRYKVQIDDYFVFKKLSCEISGYPAKVTGVELLPAKACDGASACPCKK